MFNLMLIFLEDRQSQHLILEIIFLIFIVVVVSWEGILFFDRFAWAIRCWLQFCNYLCILNFQHLILFFQLLHLFLCCHPQLSLFFKLSFHNWKLLLSRRFLFLHWRTFAITSVENSPFCSVRKLQSWKSLSWSWHWRTNAYDEPHFSLAQKRITQNSCQLWVSKRNVSSWFINQSWYAMTQTWKTTINTCQLLYSCVFFGSSQVRRNLELLRPSQINNSQWRIHKTIPFLPLQSNLKDGMRPGTLTVGLSRSSNPVFQPNHQKLNSLLHFSDLNSDQIRNRNLPIFRLSDIQSNVGEIVQITYLLVVYLVKWHEKTAVGFLWCRVHDHLKGTR